MKNLTLKKEHIKNIKYFIKFEEEKHKYGTWDKFKITSLRIHADGYYSFKVHWLYGYHNENEDYYVEGNLFDEFPIAAVLDELDAVQLLFHKIHIKAMDRLKKAIEKDIDSFYEDYEYLKRIYQPGGALNKENKIIL